MKILQWIFIIGTVLTYLIIGSQMTMEDKYCDKAPECYVLDANGNTINPK